MKIKGNDERVFQVDTRTTCGAILVGELHGTKNKRNIMQTNQVLKIYNSLPQQPIIVKCHIWQTNPQIGKKYIGIFLAFNVVNPFPPKRFPIDE